MISWLWCIPVFMWGAVAGQQLCYWLHSRRHRKQLNELHAGGMAELEKMRTLRLKMRVDDAIEELEERTH